MGELDPFDMAKRLPRRAFIWWQVRARLNLTEFHTKDEYYSAAQIAEIRGVMSEVKVPVEDCLIKLNYRTPEAAELEQIEEDENFLSSIEDTNRKIEGLKKK